MARVRWWAVALGVLFVLGTTQQVSRADEISVEGGAASISTVFVPIKEAFEGATGDRLTIKLTTPVDSLIALHRGEVDLASISPLVLEDTIAKVRGRGVPFNLSDYQQRTIAQDRVVFFVNKANKVTQLSKEQLKGIFTGALTNWKDVGGADQPIAVYWGKDAPFLNAIFSRKIMDGSKLTDRATVVGDLFALRQAVLQDPAAIVFNSNGLKMPTLKVLATPLIPLPIVVLTKGEPSPKVERLLEFYESEFGFLSE